MSFLLTSLPRGWRRHEVLIVVLSRQALPGASAGDVGAEGGVGDGDGVLAGEAFPDRRGGDLRAGLQHRVDVAVQSFEGGGLAVDLLPPGRAGGGERLDDGAAAGVVLALDGPAGHAAAGVAADRGVLLPLGCVAALDVFWRVTPCRRPGGASQPGQGAHDRGRVAAGEGGEAAGIDGAVAALGPGEVAAEVAEAQVVGCGEAAQVRAGGLALAGAG